MVDTPGTSSASDEARLELAVAAAAAERANRPRWIVVLGVLLLIGATIYTLVQVSARTAAIIKVKGAREATAQVERVKAQLDRESAKLTSRGTAPNPLMAAEIENNAHHARVILAGPVTDSPAAPLSSIGMRQVTYRARAINQDPLSLLNWLNIVQQNSPTTGLEILETRFTPGAGTANNTPGWNIDAQFTRWEKTR
jgi:hypothetical protein